MFSFDRIHCSLKINLLIVRYLIVHDQIDEALQILDKIEDKSTLDHNLILQMEIMFVKSLIYSMDYNFDAAKDKLNNLTNILTDYNLEYYRNRQRDL
jgi:hypothetical protein